MLCGVGKLQCVHSCHDSENWTNRFWAWACIVQLATNQPLTTLEWKETSPKSKVITCLTIHCRVLGPPSEAAAVGYCQIQDCMLARPVIFYRELRPLAPAPFVRFAFSFQFQGLPSQAGFSWSLPQKILHPGWQRPGENSVLGLHHWTCILSVYPSSIPFQQSTAVWQATPLTPNRRALWGVPGIFLPTPLMPTSAVSVVLLCLLNTDRLQGGDLHNRQALSPHRTASSWSFITNLLSLYSPWEPRWRCCVLPITQSHWTWGTSTSWSELRERIKIIKAFFNKPFMC